MQLCQSSFKPASRSLLYFKYLEPVCSFFQDIHSAVPIKSQVNRKEEMPYFCAKRAELEQETSICSKHLHLMPESISNPDSVFFIYTDASIWLLGIGVNG